VPFGDVTESSLETRFVHQVVETAAFYELSVAAVQSEKSVGFRDSQEPRSPDDLMRQLRLDIGCVTRLQARAVESILSRPVFFASDVTMVVKWRRR